MLLTVYRGTIEEHRTPQRGPDGFYWATVDRSHAAGFAALAARKGGTPCVIEMSVEIDGFLAVDGQGMDISRVDGTAFDGIPPMLIALQDGYPGILYRNVVDIADRTAFTAATDVLAIRDLTRIRAPG